MPEGRTTPLFGTRSTPPSLTARPSRVSDTSRCACHHAVTHRQRGTKPHASADRASNRWFPVFTGKCSLTSFRTTSYTFKVASVRTDPEGSRFDVICRVRKCIPRGTRTQKPKILALVVRPFGMPKMQVPWRASTQRTGTKPARGGDARPNRRVSAQ